MAWKVHFSQHPTGSVKMFGRYHSLLLRSVKGQPSQERGSIDRTPSPVAEDPSGRPPGEGLADGPHHRAESSTAVATVATGGWPFAELD